MRLISSFLIAALVVAAAQADAYTISGHVYDSSSVGGYFRHSNDGWPVYLLSHGDTVASTLTSGRQYQFQVASPDTYEVALMRNRLWKRDSAVVIIDANPNYTHNFAYWGYPEANGNNINDIGDLTFMFNCLSGEIPGIEPILYGDYNGDGAFNQNDMLYFFNIFRGGPVNYVVNYSQLMEQAHFLADPGLPDSVFIIPDRNRVGYFETFFLNIYFVTDDTIPAFFIPVYLQPGFIQPDSVSFLFEPLWPWLYSRTFGPGPGSDRRIMLGGFYAGEPDPIPDYPILPSENPILIASIPLQVNQGVVPGQYRFPLEDAWTYGPPILGAMSGISEWIPNYRSDSIEIFCDCGITGTVTDQLGRPAEGVMVFNDWTFRTVDSDTTDFEGHYLLDNLPPERHSISFINSFYNDTTVNNVIINEGQTVVLDMILRPDANHVIYGDKNQRIIYALPGDTIEIPVSIATDAENPYDSIGYMFMSLGSVDTVIAERLGGIITDTILDGWPDAYFYSPFFDQPQPGWSSQSVIGFYSVRSTGIDHQGIPYNTHGDTLQIASFIVLLSDNDQLLGTTVCPFKQGSQLPLFGTIDVWGNQIGTVAFYPSVNYPCICFQLPLGAGYIMGQVVDTLSMPIAGAAVSVLDSDTSAITDSMGQYFLGLIPIGSHDILFRKTGYGVFTARNVMVAEHDTVILDAMLGGGCSYEVGDINNSGSANGIDIIYGVKTLKSEVPPPVSCDICSMPTPFYAAGDVNGDCVYNGIDMVYFISYLKGINPQLYYCVDCPPIYQR